MNRWFCTTLAAATVWLAPLFAMAQTATWNGYYAGAAVGARFAVNDWVTSAACPNSAICQGGLVGPDFAQSFNSTGVRVGAFAGRNWMLAPAWLAGLEGEIGWANNRNTNGPIPGTTSSGGVPSITNGDTAAVNLSWDASLRARIGNLVRPDTLLFATAGVALQHVEVTATCGNDGFNTYCTQPQGIPHNESQTETLPGWTVGAGVEHMLAANWLVRLEYRYADYGQLNPILFAYNIGAGGDDRVFAHVRVRTHTINLGAAYKF